MRSVPVCTQLEPLHQAGAISSASQTCRQAFNMAAINNLTARNLTIASCAGKSNFSVGSRTSCPDPQFLDDSLCAPMSIAGGNNAYCAIQCMLAYPNHHPCVNAHFRCGQDGSISPSDFQALNPLSYSLQCNQLENSWSPYHTHFGMPDVQREYF